MFLHLSFCTSCFSIHPPLTGRSIDTIMNALMLLLACACQMDLVSFSFSLSLSFFYLQSFLLFSLTLTLSIFSLYIIYYVVCMLFCFNDTLCKLTTIIIIIIMYSSLLFFCMYKKVQTRDLSERVLKPHLLRAHPV